MCFIIYFGVFSAFFLSDNLLYSSKNTKKYTRNKLKNTQLLIFINPHMKTEIKKTAFPFSGIFAAVCVAVFLSACSPKAETDLRVLAPENATFAMYSKPDKKLIAALTSREDYKAAVSALKSNKAINVKYDEFLKNMPAEFRSVFDIFIDKNNAAGSIEELAITGVECILIYSCAQLSSETKLFDGALVLKSASPEFSAKLKAALDKITDAKKSKMCGGDSYEIGFKSEELKEFKIVVCARAGTFVVSGSSDAVKGVFARLDSAPKTSVFNNKLFAKVLPNAASDDCFVFVDTKLFSAFGSGSEKYFEAFGLESTENSLSVFKGESRALFKTESVWAKLLATCSLKGSDASVRIIDKAMLFLSMGAPRADGKLRDEFKKAGFPFEKLEGDAFGKIVLSNVKRADFSMTEFEVPKVMNGFPPPFLLNIVAEDTDKILTEPFIAPYLTDKPKQQIGGADCINTGMFTVAKISKERLSVISGGDVAKLLECAKGEVKNDNAAARKLLAELRPENAIAEMYMDYTAFMRVQVAMQEEMTRRMQTPQNDFASQYYKALVSLYKRYDFAANVSMEGDILVLRLKGDLEMDLNPLVKIVKDIK